MTSSMNAKAKRLINLDVDQQTLTSIHAHCRAVGCDVDQLVTSLLRDYVREHSWLLDHSESQAA